MEPIKKLKPIYFYLFGAVISTIGKSFRDIPILYYSMLIFGFSLIIFGIIKDFREK